MNIELKSEFKLIYKSLNNDNSKKIFKKIVKKWVEKLKYYENNGNVFKYNLYLNKINYNIKKINSVLEMRGGTNVGVENTFLSMFNYIFGEVI